MLVSHADSKQHGPLYSHHTGHTICVHVLYDTVNYSLHTPPLSVVAYVPVPIISFPTPTKEWRVLRSCCGCPLIFLNFSSLFQSVALMDGCQKMNSLFVRSSSDNNQ